MSDLKHCPFCGGKAGINEGPKGFSTYVYCVACQAETAASLQREKAIERWNSRHSPEPTP